MSCDNVPHNGRRRRDAVAGLAEAQDAGLRRLGARQRRLPERHGRPHRPGDLRPRARRSPATSSASRTPGRCSARTSSSGWSRTTSPPAARPSRRSASSSSPTSRPSSMMKIRILNGGHAIIAYPAGLLDIHFVHEGMEHPLVRAFLQKVERDEIIPIVPPVPGTDLDDYFALIERALPQPEDRRHHPPALPRRLQPPAEVHHPLDRRPPRPRPARRRPRARHRALWCPLLRRHAPTPAPAIEPNDPNWDRLHAPGRGRQGRPRRLARHARHLRRHRRRPGLPRRLRPLARARSGPTAPTATLAPLPRREAVRDPRRPSSSSTATACSSTASRSRCACCSTPSPPPASTLDARRGRRALPRPLARHHPRDRRPRLRPHRHRRRPRRHAPRALRRLPRRARSRSPASPRPSTRCPCAYCVASSSQPERIRALARASPASGRASPAAPSPRPMVARGKPAPDLFLHAARTLGYAPAACLVVEDSPAGIMAAQAAGMRVVAFTGGSHAATRRAPRPRRRARARRGHRRHARAARACAAATPSLRADRGEPAAEMPLVAAVDVGTGSARAGIFDAARPPARPRRAPDRHASTPRDGHAEQDSRPDLAGRLPPRSAPPAPRPAPAPRQVAGLAFDATCSLVAPRRATARPVTVSTTGEDRWDTIALARPPRRSPRPRNAPRPATACSTISGGAMSPEMQIPKLMWLKRHLPGELGARRPRLRPRRLPHLARHRQPGPLAMHAHLQMDLSRPRDPGLAARLPRRASASPTSSPAPASRRRATPVGADLGPLTPGGRRRPRPHPATRVAAGLIDAHAGALGVLGHLAGAAEIERHLALIAGTSSCVMAFVADAAARPRRLGPLPRRRAPRPLAERGRPVRLRRAARPPPPPARPRRRPPRHPRPRHRPRRRAPRAPTPDLAAAPARPARLPRQPLAARRPARARRHLAACRSTPPSTPSAGSTGAPASASRSACATSSSA